MLFKQISIFLENSTGRIEEVTSVLAKAKINLRAISIADTRDFGILRVIVDKNDEALKALGDAGFAFKLSDVAAVEVGDTPGSLLKVLELFREKQINIEYMYAFLAGKPGIAAVIFKLDDMQRGQKVIEENNLSMIDKIQ